jgi:hypothetical protein
MVAAKEGESLQIIAAGGLVMRVSNYYPGRGFIHTAHRDRRLK